LELLDEVGLAGRARDLPANLSGGERQRVAIARALAGRPRLLLADEPTGALDSVASREMWKLLGDIRSRHGTTVMIATHDVTLAEQADRPLELADGHLVSPEQPSPTVQGVT
jgi:putative ABC transport system ATP-binding protein